MPSPSRFAPKSKKNHSTAIASSLFIVGASCALLYWARAVFIPVALAVLINFILAPVVRRLTRWKIPRVLAVCLTVGVALVAFGGLGWAVTLQISDFAEQIPARREIIKDKLAHIRGISHGGSIEKIQDTIESINEEIEQEEEVKKKKGNGDATGEPEVAVAQLPVLPPPPPAIAAPTRAPVSEAEPMPVIIVPKNELFDLANLASFEPLFASAGQSAVVIVLVILLMISEDDMRNRIVALAGEARLAVTTKALHDAGRRISSYLSTQLFLNGVYGIAVGVGLYLIGLPYAVLWGFCAAIFRYIPYVGPWVAALLPVATAFVVSPGWQMVGSVLILIVVLELISNNIMEPWLFGRSVGIPALVLLVSALFWTWLWGPVGLVLSTPLTVCMVAVGEYVPSLGFLARLLGSESKLPAELLLYQRLLAHDAEGVSEIIRDHASEENFDGLYTAVDAVSRDLIAPVLPLLKRDVASGNLADEDQQRIIEILQEEIETLKEIHSNAEEITGSAARIVLCPASDSVDETAARLLALVLQAGGASCSVLSPKLLSSEISDLVSVEDTRMVCVVSVSPGAVSPALRLCKRLERSADGVEIAVNYWGQLAASRTEEFKAAGADFVTTDLWGGHDLLAPRDQFYSSQTKQRLA